MFFCDVSWFHPGSLLYIQYHCSIVSNIRIRIELYFTSLCGLLKKLKLHCCNGWSALSSTPRQSVLYYAPSFFLESIMTSNIGTLKNKCFLHFGCWNRELMKEQRSHIVLEVYKHLLLHFFSPKFSPHKSVQQSYLGIRILFLITSKAVIVFVFIVIHGLQKWQTSVKFFWRLFLSVYSYFNSFS